MEDIKYTFNCQREFFASGLTRNPDFRIEQLNKLRKVILNNEARILEALNKDLHKGEFEGYTTEVGIILSEIKHISKNIKKWSKPKRVSTSIINFPSSSYIYKEPYGVSLIISPWNYPFQLSIAPLIGAIAAGNCAVIKPSELSPNTSEIIAEIINSNFDREYIHVINGGIETNQALLNEEFDYIFYTGGIHVGKIVMEAASKHLTPVTLELGGKSPCIVDKEGNIELFARRIVWGKFLNAGQTCVAPDYVLVHRDVKDTLVKNMIKFIKEFYGDNPMESQDYPRIINERHFKRLISLIDKAEVLTGGNYDIKNLYIAPTIIDGIDWDHPVMSDEIFGPILPILDYENINDVIKIVNSHPKPLALYFFSSNSENQKKIMENISFGGGCINDTIMHLTSSSMPFGGVGLSGMGGYHGKWSFDTFSHEKSILKKSAFIDIPLRYPPFNDRIKIAKRIMK